MLRIFTKNELLGVIDQRFKKINGQTVCLWKIFITLKDNDEIRVITYLNSKKVVNLVLRSKIS
jgi:hypothetical protein